ncbi:orotate phosphoribosyltransferase [Alteribacter natronophilus]|uniref:orotate phosphoribosyltransferase n=1 Tax=Alteribacter natronophilus TaxID=2583810 RepID=UPI00110D2F55|nr:orotate phosphoribosyltransferase [Alteribacter natronophilus]TMW73154.1 orotate phosphoribosyltransferase [Alteribacter natronophilus]
MSSQTVAKALLDIEAVSLKPDEPFTWSSGMKSPIYCDNRLTMSYPEVRKQIAQGFASLIRSHYPNAEVVAGTATAGIPHAAWVAEELNLPMIYVRSKAKEHGRKNKIEGRLKEGDRVVIIEDLISTGGSSLQAAYAVREAGGSVEGVAAIFTYGLQQAEEAFRKAEIPYAAITDFATLSAEADLSEEQKQALRSWQEDPKGWSDYR